MDLTIDIIHRLRDRLRIKLSEPIKNFEKLKFQVMEHSGVNTFDYNTYSQTLLLRFDASVVQAQELIIRTAVAYSLENDLSPVKICQKERQEFITPKGLVAGLSILSAFVLNFSSKNVILKTTANWISAATTMAAVVEHAAFDYRKKGSVDPEVLSLGLLVNSIVNNKKVLMPSALTWVSTFGRHFSSSDREGILLEVTKRKEEGKKAYYHLNIGKLKDSGNMADLFYMLAKKFLNSESGFNNTIFEGAKDLMNSHEKFIEGMGEKNNGMVLYFDQDY